MATREFPAWLKRGIFGSLFLSLSLVGFIGFLHAPSIRGRTFARKILSAMGAVCPIRLLPETEAERLRQGGLMLLRGAAKSKSRPAFGFRLGKTTEAEAAAYFQGKGLPCQGEKRGFALLRCKNVPEKFLAAPQNYALDELTLSFKKGVLISAGGSRRHLSAAEGLRGFYRAAAAVRASAGRATLSQGGLGGKAYSTSVVQYRAEDYYAKIAAIHLPGGVAIFELYEDATLEQAPAGTEAAR